MTNSDGLNHHLENLIEDLGVSPSMSQVIVRASSEVPTGCWVLQPNGVVEILINDVLAAEASADELYALLLHEAFHHVGYNQLQRLRGLVDVPCEVINIALDIAINYLIERMTPYGRGLGYLVQRILGSEVAYDSDETVDDDLSISLLSNPFPPKHRMSPRFQLAWENIWDSNIPVTPENCLQLLMSLLNDRDLASLESADETSQPCFLTAFAGNYESEDELPSLDGSAAMDVNESMGASCLDADFVSGELHDVARQMGVGTSPGTEWIRIGSRQLVDRSVGEVENWVRSQMHTCINEVAGDVVGKSTGTNFLPYMVKPTMQEVVKSSLGFPRFYYANRRPMRYNPMPVYIDVSGSMHGFMSTIHSLVQALQQILPSTLHLFDMCVHPQTKIDTEKGIKFDGGGTSFDCVFEHAMDQLRTRDILVITDDCGFVSASVMARAADVGLKARAVILEMDYDGQFAVRFDRPNPSPWWFREFIWMVDPYTTQSSKV